MHSLWHIGLQTIIVEVPYFYNQGLKKVEKDQMRYN